MVGCESIWNSKRSIEDPINNSSAPLYSEASGTEQDTAKSAPRAITGETIEAVSFDAESNPENAKIVSQRKDSVGHTNDGNWIRFDNVSFDEETSKLTIVASSPRGEGIIEARIGSPEGTLIASVPAPVEKGWNTFESFDTETIQPIPSGDLYILFKAAGDRKRHLMNLQSFRFE